MRVGVVVNPTAGRGRGRGAGAETIAALRAAGVQVVDVSAPSHRAAGRNASAAVGAGDVDGLVVVGGDGMVHLGVNAVAASEVPLGVVAVGTGNDFARAAGLPLARTEPAVAALVEGLAGEPGRVDAGVLTHAGRSVWFAGVVSAGLDAAVNAHANRITWPTGRGRYVRSALREITRFAPYGYRVAVWGPPTGDTIAGVRVERTSDGATRWESPGTLVAVANTGWIGGGVHVAPDASLTDGLFDVVVAGPFTRPGAARIFPGMYTGAHLRHDRVAVMRATRVTVEATGTGTHPPDAYADGERVGAVPLDIRIVPGALRVIGTRENRCAPSPPITYPGAHD